MLIIELGLAISLTLRHIASFTALGDSAMILPFTPAIDDWPVRGEASSLADACLGYLRHAFESYYWCQPTAGPYCAPNLNLFQAHKNIVPSHF